MTEGMNLMAIIKVKISEARVEYLEHLEARGLKASTRRVYEGLAGHHMFPVETAETTLRVVNT